MELVASTAGLQPLIVPLSLAKMNRAGPDLVPEASVTETTNPEPPLKTAPVGAPLAMLTTRPCFAPSALYNVDLSVPLSATHQGPLGGSVIPHPF
jgi:hypothetical protein